MCCTCYACWTKSRHSSAGWSASRPADVIDYYAATLTTQGWSIVERDGPRPWIAQPSEPPSDGPEPLADPEWSGSLLATRDDVELSVVHDVGWTTQQDGYGWELRGTVYVILSETESR